MIKVFAQRTQSQRVITAIHYILFAIVVLRAALSYGGTPGFGAGLALLVLCLILYATEPRLSQRWLVYRWIYFSLEAGLVAGLGLMAPDFDFLWGLYVILGTQVVEYFSIRVALVWSGALIIIAGLFLMAAKGAPLGLAILLNLIAVGYFIVSFARASSQAEVERNESAALLRDLQTAHAQLQADAARAEELSTERERTRLARELHDSVNQAIFSLTLTAEATRLLLEKDPVRVPEQLDRMQAMTGSALGQLRSLITQLRPKD